MYVVKGFSPGIIGTSKIFWTDLLSEILQMIVFQGKYIEFIRYIKGYFPTDDINLSGSAQQSLEEIIRFLKIFREEKIILFIETLGRIFNFNPYPYHNKFLSWRQIDELKISGLVNFGSHSVSHRILTNLTDEEIHTELRTSKECLIKRGVSENHSLSFCYPNGNYNDNIMRILKMENYFNAFTTRSGFNEHDSPAYELKRIGLHQDISFNKELLAYRIYSSY